MTSQLVWRPVLKDAVPLQDLKRVLVVKLRNLGDVLLTSPVFSVLAVQAPHLEIDALVYEDTAEMLSGHPSLSQLHTIDRGWRRMNARRRLQREWALLGALRARRYDLVIHLTPHRRGAWLTRLLRPRHSVAPDGGYGRFFDRSFSHRFRVVGGNRRHTVEMHLDSLRRIGVYPDAASRKLVFVEGPEAAARVARLLAENGLDKGAFVVVHPSSRWHFKCWPVDHMARLIEGLQQRGHAMVMTGSPDPDETQITAALAAQLRGSIVDLSGRLNLKELGALIRQARLFVGVDSAPMHIAAAVGTPTVALFGPSGEIEWGPWLVPCRVLTSDHRCRPCGFDGCGGGKRSECLDGITPERALAAAEELLGAAR